MSSVRLRCQKIDRPKLALQGPPRITKPFYNQRIYQRSLRRSSLARHGVRDWQADPRVRGNPRTGKLHGFEPSIKQRGCAEGDREADGKSSSPGAACSTMAMALRGSSLPRPPPRKARAIHTTMYKGLAGSPWHVRAADAAAVYRSPQRCLCLCVWRSCQDPTLPPHLCGAVRRGGGRIRFRRCPTSSAASQRRSISRHISPYLPISPQISCALRRDSPGVFATWAHASLTIVDELTLRDQTNPSMF